MDVGVDGNNLKPISMEEILTILKDKKKVNLVLPKDHHQKI
jgi:calcineurin-like phosphoesterase family protein